MTFTLNELWQMFLALCASIATVAGAGAILHNLYIKAKKPDTERDKTMNEHSEEIKNLKDRQQATEESMVLLMRATLAMMNHIINGDSINEIKKASEDIQEYLISNKTNILKDK